MTAPISASRTGDSASLQTLSTRQTALEQGAGDLSAQQQALLLDLTQLTLDLVGIVDPTGAADLASGAISLSRGDWLGAAISGISALLPYAGDLAKLGKLPKLVETLGNIVNVAKTDARFAQAVRPMMDQLRSALRGADFSFLPEGAQRAMRSLQAKADEFFRTAKLARGEGAFALAETLPYTPAGRVFGQMNESSCVAASIRMVLRNGDEVPESIVRQVANVDNLGGTMTDAARALQELGASGYRAVDGLNLAGLETALGGGQSVIVSVRTELTGGAHALVVDAVRDGKVFVRDPYPPGMGASYAIAADVFAAAMTGRAVIP